MAKKKIIARSTRLSFPVVGIGASAGGLDAFIELLKNVPSDTGMAFVLLQHLDPTHESILSNIIARTTKMLVLEARNRMPVEPDHVYIMPPNKDMTLVDGKFGLVSRPKTSERHLPIDLFFTSLAKVKRNQSIGIILSGTASDGVAGQRAIKAAGGITFSQDLKSARFSGMPRNAIASGCIDHVMPPQAIAKALAELGKKFSYHQQHKKGLEHVPKNPKDDLAKIFALLKCHSGVDFTRYKKTTLERRIKRRMAVTKKAALKDYIQCLRKDPAEVERLFQDLLIGVTSFFRDPALFAALRKKVFPTIVKNRIPDQPIRIWVTACSTGEEAYSLAICLLESFGKKANSRAIQVFASDVNEAVVEKARRGAYPESIQADVPPELLARYFVKEGGGYRVIKAVRDICVFARQDLTRDPPFSKLDLVSCRNMLIYMEPDLQKKIFPVFHYSLKPSGFLVLGTSESLNNVASLFSVVDKKFKIYAKKYVQTWPAMPLISEQYSALLSGKSPGKKIAAKKSIVLVGDDQEREQAQDEELRSAMEEIQSANEELQSANEELETSKEEIQSTNEELSTLNDELTNRNVELVRLSSDIQNLFNSTRMPVIMIGRDLCVRRFTPMAAKVWNLIPTDIGRRITDLNPNIPAPHLKDMLLDAIDHLKTGEVEVLEKNGRWSLMTVYPYKTTENKIDGAVITLFDIHASKMAQEKIEKVSEYFKSIVEAVSDPLIVLDKRMGIKTANKSFYQQFKVSSRRTQGQSLYDLGDHHWDIPALRKLLKDVFAKGAPVDDVEISHEFAHIGKRVLLVSARKMQATLSEDEFVLLGIKDVTEARQVEQKIRNLASFPELNPSPIYEINMNGTIGYRNAAAKKLQAEGFACFDDSGIMELIEFFSAKNIKQHVREIKCGEHWYLQSAYRVAGTDVLRVYNADITKRKKAEEVLRESEARFRLLYENAPVSYQSLDKEGMFLDVNQTWLDTLGYSREEVIGRWFGDFLTPEYSELFRTRFLCFQADKEVHGIEFDMVRKDGSPMRVSFEGRIGEDANGFFKQTHCVFTNITERKRMEAAIRESEQRFRLAITEAPFPLMIHAEDGTVIAVSRTWTEITGYALADIPTTAIWTEKAYGPNKQAVREDIEALYSLTQRKAEGEYTIMCRDGAKRTWDFSSVALGRMPDGRRIVLSMAADVTERKQTEQELALAHGFSQAILENMEAGVVACDAAGNLVLFNRVAREWHGLDPRAIPQDEWARYYNLYMEDGVAPMMVETIPLLRAFRGEAVQNVEMVIAAEGKLQRQIVANATPIHDAAGRVIGAIAVMMDVTERKKAEEVLRRAKESAESANRSKSEFLANVSHDLRTPLNAIVGFCALLGSEVAADQRPRMIEIIKNQGKNVSSLISEILDVSRLEAGKVELRDEEFVLEEIVSVAVDSLKTEKGNRNIRVDFSYDQAIPRLKGDPIRIGQIMNNLLNNALKYTEEGVITIRIERASEADGKGMCCIRGVIKDTGIGIPPEKLPYIFDPFIRAHEFVKDKDVAGTGLGLFISRTFINLMGGDIRVTSEEGKGSEFIFTLNFKVAASPTLLK
ncbi:MAG: PAS domain S-box protein [Candidatus Omnitrophica bacterium]|nr:PAS domain S-box protein [Candidatus Omnitrophota bacterium]